MSALLYGVGVLAFVAGVVMAGFGIAIDLSFGNTLIGAGVNAAIGGLIVIGLGVVVAQLNRLNDALATRAPVRPGRPSDLFENAAAERNVPPAARVPFPPPRPKADAGLNEPPALEPHQEHIEPAETLPEPQPAPTFAPPPMLRNPEEAPVTVDDDVSLSPPHPMAPVGRGAGGRATDTAGIEAHRYDPKLETSWRPPSPPVPPPMHFDAMWPEPKPAKSQESADLTPMAPPPPRHAEPDMRPARPASEPRGVAILKSGVVDGMGYTLYVDGSIEAELPQGTLRFSSINELRSHLEKNS
jgi:hypothetical protein